ncbi:sensor histidine kinase [Mizugakiibacter sediminis]|uniref:sensor histidine kinase n=1 Tax=Mizugakiibacter sediminis TaxID=1475481 RepID=UPI000AE66EB4|nr:histidine kinase [Mizugakiibacter sediminis]
MIDRSLQRRFGVWTLAFAFWTLLALSYTVSNGISSISEGHEAAWLRLAVWNFGNFYLWMALTPLVAWLGRLGAAGWRRFWALHLPCSLALALALAQSLAMLAIFWWLCGPGHAPATTFAAYARLEFAYKLHLGWLTYWVLLAALRGLETRRRLRDERLRSAQLETQLVQSQLQTLRMQLQPHFLFNTLNAISALALSDPMQARLMIARLSDFLRLTLEERHAQQVPLARELQLLDCYLGVQQVRFQDRLIVRMDVAADTVRAAVPNMILQPLVENALRHGLLNKPGPGTLHIVTRRDGDHLQLCVDDDGLGLPQPAPAEGLGLGTTRARLRVLFGEAARLQLSRRPGGGTRAELRLPYAEGAP